MEAISTEDCSRPADPLMLDGDTQAVLQHDVLILLV
jgi:hypothetical protein